MEHVFASPLKRLLLTGLLVSTTNACAPAPEAIDEGAASAEQAIAGGYEDTEDTATVGVFNAAKNWLCTGSLIAPNLVLTARHCVSDVSSAMIECGKTSFGALWDAAGFYVTTHAEVKSETVAEMLVAEVVALPDDPSDVCGNDVAMLVLSKNVAASKAVPYEPRLDSPLLAGEDYYAVGYGATDEAGNGAGLRRRRDDLTVDCVASGCIDAAVKDTEWLGDEGICQGDSGGPALDLQDRVVGVTSRGAPGCASPIYGYTVAWASWIKDTAVLAAAKGSYEAPTWTAGSTVDPSYGMPVGATCNKDEDCPTERCTNSYCTRPCTKAYPCPQAYICQEADGESVCIAKTTSAPQSFARADKSDCSVGRVGSSRRGPSGRSWALLVTMLTAIAWRRRH